MIDHIEPIRCTAFTSRNSGTTRVAFGISITTSVATSSVRRPRNSVIARA